MNRRRVIDVRRAGFQPGRFRPETAASQPDSRLAASLGERVVARQLAATEPDSRPASPKPREG